MSDPGICQLPEVREWFILLVMQTERNDPYLASLEAQEKKLDAEERALDEMEAALKAGRDSVAAGRVTVRAARDHYLGFLAEQRKRAVPEKDYRGDPMPSGVAVIPLPSRIGPKHRCILEAIREGDGLTARQIADQTGVKVDVIRNFIIEDSALGILDRPDGRAILTPAGKDYMERLAAKFGPPAPLEETPPAAASGVFQ